jgi:hypothetical protein
MSVNLQKFKLPVMTRKAGGKNNVHDTGWIAKVLDAVRVGTAPAIRAARTMAYHGVLPHAENDLNKPIEARVSSEPLEPQDVPDATDGIIRKISAEPFPPAHGMRDVRKPS